MSSVRSRNIFLCFLLLMVYDRAPGYCEYNDTQVKIREFYLRGNLYYQQRKYKEADEEYNKAITLVNPQPEKKEVVVSQSRKEEKDQQRETGEVLKPVAATQTNEYLIGEDDILHISVWQNPDLDLEVTVRPDGKISFPLVGDIHVAGMTIPQLSDKITNALKDYVRFPQVSISLKKIGGTRIMILGQVVTPGIYQVIGGKTIMEAIMMAGGFTRDGVPSSTILVRGGLKSPSAKRINISRIFKGDLSQNVVLRSQDIIFIPRKFITDISYFLNTFIDPISKGAYTYQQSQTWGQSPRSATVSVNSN